MILCAPAGAEAGSALAERVAQAFASPFALNGQNIRVTASLGIAVAPDNGVTADELMRHADIALYEAKDAGRDRAVLFSDEMARQVERRRAIELDLRAAIEADMLCLNYQPIVSSAYRRDRRLGGAVALAPSRVWRDVARGLHSHRGKCWTSSRARRMGAQSCHGGIRSAGLIWRLH